jgi:hypothetical protein
MSLARPSKLGNFSSEILSSGSDNRRQPQESATIKRGEQRLHHCPSSIPKQIKFLTMNAA